MPVTVSVEDPISLVSHIEVLAESDDVVALMVWTGRKPCVVNAVGTRWGCTLCLDSATIAVDDLPFDKSPPILSIDVHANACIWTIVRSDAGRTLYTKEKSHASI